MFNSLKHCRLTSKRFISRINKPFQSTNQQRFQQFSSISQLKSNNTRKYAGPLFVFLEGGAATGKSSLCQELLDRNYTVQFENFVQLCSEV
jgi:predicted GTPase